MFPIRNYATWQTGTAFTFLSDTGFLGPRTSNHSPCRFGFLVCVIQRMDGFTSRFSVPQGSSLPREIRRSVDFIFRRTFEDFLNGLPPGFAAPFACRLERPGSDRSECEGAPSGKAGERSRGFCGRTAPPSSDPLWIPPPFGWHVCRSRCWPPGATQMLILGWWRGRGGRLSSLAGRAAVLAHL